MATIEIHVDSHVSDVMKAVDEKIMLALDLMGEVAEGYAKEDCPVDTGLLRNSITHAVSGQTTSISSYHAERTSTGESATSGTTGSVGFGAYSGAIGSSGVKECYVGTNVEYAPYVEFIDSYHHPVGKAHFLRDGAVNHVNEIKAVAETALSSI